MWLPLCMYIFMSAQRFYCPCQKNVEGASLNIALKEHCPSRTKPFNRIEGEGTLSFIKTRPLPQSGISFRKKEKKCNEVFVTNFKIALGSLFLKGNVLKGNVLEGKCSVHLLSVCLSKYHVLEHLQLVPDPFQNLTKSIALELTNLPRQGMGTILQNILAEIQ